MAKSRSEIDKERVYREIMSSDATKGGKVVGGVAWSAIPRGGGGVGVRGRIPPDA